MPSLEARTPPHPPKPSVCSAGWTNVLTWTQPHSEFISLHAPHQLRLLLLDAATKTRRELSFHLLTSDEMKPGRSYIHFVDLRLVISAWRGAIGIAEPSQSL